MDFKALPGVPSHIFPLESRSDKDACEIKRELAETKNRQMPSFAKWWPKQVKYPDTQVGIFSPTCTIKFHQM